MSTPNTSPATNITAQKATVEAQYKKLIDGINAELSGVDPFLINNQSIARVDLLKHFQERIDAAETTKAKRATFHQAVEAERAVAAMSEPLRTGIRRLLQTRFGPRSTKLQDFGFTPNKTPKKTVAAKATGVAKAKATRAARGTKGKNQKKSIKGAPAPVPASAPAQNAPGPTAPPVPTPTAGSAAKS